MPLALTLLMSVLLPPAMQDPGQPMLVGVEWLAARLGQPGLVILHIGDDRSKATYDAGHIPGSQFLHPWNELAAPRVEGGLSLELPSVELLKASLEAKGVSNNSQIVLVHAQEYFTPTTRTYLTLMYAGLTGRVSILNGGLEAWQAAGHPVTAELPKVVRGRFSPKLDPGVVVDIDYVAQRLEAPGVAVLDARAPEFYNGAETRQGRNGRIPGAANLPFTSLFENGGFKDLETLVKIFAEAGVRPGQQVVTYCHIGQQATAVWFAARLLGYNAAMFDGSFQEWARHVELPVVTPGDGQIR